MPTLQRLAIEQGRAKYAYDCAVEGFRLIKKKEYKGYVKRLPMLIKTNGLGSAISFIKAKSDQDENKKGYAYHKLYKHITGWLLESKTITLLNDQELVEYVVSQPSQSYRYLTIEVMAFLAWLKRFSEGLIEGDAEGE